MTPPETSRASAVAVLDAVELDMAHAAWLSREALRRPLGRPAELGVFIVRGPRTALLGSFQRSTDRPAALDGAPLERRGSGGPTLQVGGGMLWLQLALATPDALVPCTPSKLLNRHVRPLLKALTSLGRLSHYFGRDWIATRRRPSAWVGFAHHATSGRSLVEALVPVEGLVPWPEPRASLMGKAPWTLGEADSAAPLIMERVRERLVTSYVDDLSAGASPVVATIAPTHDASPIIGDDPPWQAWCEDAIGRICAGRDGAGRLRLGGEFMASVDAVQAVEDGVLRLGSGLSADAVGQLIDGAFARSNGTILGVTDLRKIRDVLLEAARERNGSSS